MICGNCWNKVSNFHEFYQAVEKAHRLLTERFSLKSGQDQPKPEAPEEPHVLEQDEVEENADEEEEDDRNPAFSGAPSDDESTESFSNEQFLNEVITQEEEEVEEEVKETTQPEAEEVPSTATGERRETRSSAKIKSQAPADLPPPAVTKVPVSKKRAKKNSSKAEATPTKNKRYADYKQSMLAIDAKIAAHMRLTCDVCHEGQETFLLLCKHMLQAHHRKGYAVCCNKKFYKRSFLTDHIDRHADPEKFK